ncbi:NADH pyrophosphatase [Actinomyces bovis]|uniref:NAD(+) diphosphatase n=1 Tax=Actinomyces bovis TaxID=1658 RepID=A0ABY1VL73_9ACTO|nr:NAD(+) diphosphatase [Actinomyces bovis]SPT52760.1 NADH pyrophosphatase [Actinomyces bovis]VEG54765.1 NADH pyrophosphatase [Actinomyces israelii]
MSSTADAQPKQAPSPASLRPASPSPSWFRSLSRHVTDRDATRRDQPGLLAALAADSDTRVLLVDARGRVALAAQAGIAELPDDGLTPSVPTDADRAVWHQGPAASSGPGRTGGSGELGDLGGTGAPSGAANPRKPLKPDHPGGASAAEPRLATLTVADLPATLREELIRAAQEPKPADSRLQLIYLGQEPGPCGPKAGQRPAAWLGVVVPAETAADATALAAGITPGTPASPVPQDAEGAALQDAGLLKLLARYPLTALRAIGAELDAHDAGLATPATALATWHARTSFCPACGGKLVPVQAGWARACQACGGLHFPRTDPAVIMAVTDVADRLLLVHGATWSARRYSVVAGFVEAGESAEQAVYREVWEETGLRVTSVEPFATQPWPFPRSLMLGYRARLAAGETQPRPDGQEVTEALWFSRCELVAALQAGRIGLPGPTSIARALIEDWLGAAPHCH